ncbi:hypothetical protein F8M41_013972 [Gigaspora margarita]|uniref:Uncharacterized protein n=1 Tax=Gigaspora margarita TaxID=4874 RepID=A0A8H4AS02_GIGMA|nr:hypothetical protein F8M41_013972 [Gigaspora margarita]
MSSSKSEERQLEDQSQISISIDEPHGGKRIRDRSPLVDVSDYGQNILNLDNYSVFFTENILKLLHLFTNDELNKQHVVSSIFETNDRKNAVYVYSTKSGRMAATKTFDEELHNFFLIKLSEEEHLFFSGPQHSSKSYNSYILNPLTFTLNESPGTDILHGLCSPTYQDDESIGPINIISDYIIKLNNNHLRFKNCLKIKVGKII